MSDTRSLDVALPAPAGHPAAGAIYDSEGRPYNMVAVDVPADLDDAAATQYAYDAADPTHPAVADPAALAVEAATPADPGPEPSAARRWALRIAAPLAGAGTLLALVAERLLS